MTCLEARLLELTKPINGQYPRPWMTDSSSPESAKVFIVGFNQARTFPAEIIDHASYIDALFNRNGQSIRHLYAKVSGDNGPSKTSENISELTSRLNKCCVAGILQTKLVCYSTPMGKNLLDVEHIGGAKRGQEIFRTVLEEIRPRILVIHGARTRKALSRLLKTDCLVLPSKNDDNVSVVRNLKYPSSDRYVDVFPIPSLAPPAWNRWQNWAFTYFDKLCQEISASLA